MERTKEQNQRVFDSWAGWWNATARMNTAVYDAVVTRLSASHRHILDVQASWPAISLTHCRTGT